MAETEYSTTARLSVDTIWDFVKEMDNWAPLLTGYQAHEKQSETDSLWTVKGDVGVLARVVKFKVHITEWNGPERVSFELEGVNELLKGQGVFIMQRYEEEPAGAASAQRKNVFTRVVESLLRFFLRLFRGRPERAAASAAGPGEGWAQLTFKLRIDPGGPMAPMINAMMKPAMEVVAEDLSNRIIAQLEAQQGSKA
ncbi:MAG: SRPBCC family protein [Deltaproteobacteria bacterium]|nr:SRPBCC family protein [Deltaproteobacteria bacterium]